MSPAEAVQIYFYTKFYIVKFIYRLRNDLYCVGWGVKLYSIQSFAG